MDAKQALQLEIEQLRGNLNVMRHIRYEGDEEVLNKVELLLKALREKESELGDLETINQTLVVQERQRNDELQDARKELVNVSCLTWFTYMGTNFSPYFLSLSWHLAYIIFYKSLIIRRLGNCWAMKETHNCFFTNYKA